MPPSGRPFQHRLLLLEPPGVTCPALHTVVEAAPDLLITQVVADLQSAVGRCRSQPPDAAIVLANWQTGATLDEIQQLSQAVPALAILLLNVDAAPLRVAVSFAAGARGYVDAAGIADLPYVIRLIARGGFGCCSVSAAELAGRIGQNQALSPRERLIAAQVAAGQTNAEIAATLSLKLSTIETHVERILRKIQGRTRIDIATWWMHHSGEQAAAPRREPEAAPDEEQG